MVSEPSLVGSRLGKYEVKAEIGRGGMGTVYLGYDPLLDRQVAIKVLAPHLVWNREFVERFLREARAAARLKHPNIVTVYDVGQEGSWYYFVMEHLVGESLAARLQRGALPAQEALAILRPLAAALDYAHYRGIVHRDVKPGNVILGPEGQVTLMDFGIARAAQEGRLTGTGTIVGTPEYMSPEQAKGLGVDARTDQYSLAVVAYQMLSGQVPFQADSTLALMYKVVHEPPPPLADRRPDLPPAIGTALEKALAKEPGERYPTATAFVDALEQTPARVTTAPDKAAILTPPPSFPAKPPRRAAFKLPIMKHVPKWAWKVAAGVAVLAVLITVALGIRSQAPPTYTPSIGAIYWTGDRLLWGNADWLFDVPTSATGRVRLVVGGEGTRIRAISQDASGQLWTGLDGSGIERQQGDKWTRYTFDKGPAADTVQAIAADRQGIWVGTRDGAAYFNGTAWFFYTPSDGLGGADVRAIAVSPDDTVWFGTWGDGLTARQENKAVTYRFGNDARWNSITALQPLGKDLWVGTQAGLVRFDSAREAHYYTHADGLSSDFVTALAASPNGQLWIGTWGGGVSLYDGGRMTSTTFNASAFNYVAGLAVGGNKVWALASRGLMVFDLETQAWIRYE